MPKLENDNVGSAAALSEKLRRGDLSAQDCPSRDILKHVTSLWGVLALVALRDERLRFSDMRRKLGGVSKKMLAQTLRVLESDGFVERTPYPVTPPHVEYGLAPLGKEVAERVASLVDWIETITPQVIGTRGLRRTPQE